ncbi:MAG: hypothetical protein LUE08_01390 [Akkermansiaceae bacterium]|nr:hypothetical protein [Akkermansiaceae bacterium]
MQFLRVLGAAAVVCGLAAISWGLLTLGWRMADNWVDDGCRLVDCVWVLAGAVHCWLLGAGGFVLLAFYPFIWWEKRRRRSRGSR